MKRIAALTAALILALSLHLTAFADIGFPGPDEVGNQPTAIAEVDPGNNDNNDNNGNNGNDGNGPEGIIENVENGTEAPAGPGNLGDDLQNKLNSRIAPTTEEPSEEPAEAKAKTATKDSEAQSSDDSTNTIMIVLIICGAVLLILLIVIVAVLLRKKNPSAGSAAAVGSGHGVAVRVEVISGYCWNAGFDFNLRRNLTVGTDKGCDLVFDDPQMLPMHAVISRTPNGVTISECADTKNTYVGGMKIFAPNTLRSGDIVTIGATTFRVFF